MSTLGAAPFQIKQTINSPLKHKVMTTLPLPEKIQGLKPLEEQFPALYKSIMQCLKQIYSYVTDRAYIENTVTFFHHACSTALYEKFYRQKIKEKDHGKKLGSIFCQIKNTLSEIETALRNPQLEKHYELLCDFQAELIWQHNICVNVIPTLSDEVKAHLKKHANIDDKILTPLLTSPRKRTRVQSMHPGTPPSEKVIPFQERRTPKKMSLFDRLTEHLIRNHGEMRKPLVEQPLNPPESNKKAILLMLPRAIRLKRELRKSTSKDPLMSQQNIENGLTNQPKI